MVAATHVAAVVLDAWDVGVVSGRDHDAAQDQPEPDKGEEYE